jgi:hypothetical protein
MFQKSSVLILLSLFQIGKLYSQSCGFEETLVAPTSRNYSTTISCVNENVGANSNDALYVPEPSMEIKTVRLVLHVMQRSDSTLNLNENDSLHLKWLNNCDDYLNFLMSNLQEEWCDGVLTNSPYVQDSRIRFKTEAVVWHQDDQGWNNNSTTFAQSDVTLCSSYCYDNFALDREHVLNIYIIGSTRTLEGYEYSPSPDEVMKGCGPGYYGPSSNYITLVGLYDNFLRYPQGYYGDSSYIGQPWVEYPLLLHEIGHCLGLLHSWTPTQEMLFDLCDTDYMPSCIPESTINCSNNVMSYSNTRLNFNYLQLAHMHQLLSGGSRTAMLCECIRDESRDVEIENDQTWLTGKVFGGNLIVNSGVTLIIKCKVNMPKGGAIIIKPGGKIIIDGGVCTNSCGYFWNGIEVWGQDNQPQLASTQGSLELKNGAVIENANCGVRLGRLTSAEPNWLYDWSMTGGIIRSSSNTTFKNNKKDVEFLSYQNFNVQGVNEIPKKNVSYFFNTNFIVEKSLDNHPTLGQRISLYDVDGIRFKSCNFQILGDALTHYEIQNRGYGIYSLASSFSVTGGCTILPVEAECDPGYLTAETLGESGSDITPSRFNNFLYGIRSIGGDGFANTTVQSTIFTDNQFGIFLKAIEGASIYRNRFFIKEQNFSLPISYGVSLLGCNGYEVERNIFQGTGNLASLNTGLWISSSPDVSNEIYLNDFVDLYGGTFAQGVQAGGFSNLQGLELLCGKYENTKYNIAVLNTNQENGIIALRQGNGEGINNIITAPAGNLFTQTVWGSNEPSTDFYICPDGHCAPVIYEHHNSASSWPVVPIQVDSDLLETSPNDVTFIERELACPVNHGVINTPTNLNLIVGLNRLQIGNIRNDLNELIDGGNTAALKSMVNNINYSSAYVRSNLLAIAPYLSDEILHDLIYKQPEMNPWHLCEILIACSPLSPTVYNKVNSTNQLSEFLFSLLTEYQSGTNEFISKETQLKQLELEKAYALNNYIRTRLAEDAENYFLEEVKQLITGDEINEEIKIKIAILRQEKKYSEAFALLTNYNEDSTRDVWKQVMTVFLNIDLAGGYAYATQGQIIELTNLAQSGKEGNYTASALLEVITGIHPDEELNLPKEGLKAMKIIDRKTRPSLIGVYPNPALNEFYISYVLPEIRESAFIRISDIQGRLIYNENVETGFGLLNLNAKQFAKGSYILDLIVNGQKVASEKLQVIE